MFNFSNTRYIKALTRLIAYRQLLSCQNNLILEELLALQSCVTI